MSSIEDNAIQLLAHRGPDGNGVWKSAEVTLVHTRLSIIGRDEVGAQPMVLKEGCIQREAMDVVPASQAEDVRGSRRKVIVFNGEIYNYRDLRAEMEAQGRPFNMTRIRRCFSV